MSILGQPPGLFDEELEKWRNRPLSYVPFLQLNARYENVRHDGAVVSCAVLAATGVNENGKRFRIWRNRQSSIGATG